MGGPGVAGPGTGEPGSARPIAVQRSGAVPAPEILEGHVRFLADDRLRGREPGTAGYDAAAEYVAGHFAVLALEPAGDDGSYLQSVPLHISRRDSDAARMAVHWGERTEPLVSLQDFVLDAQPGHATSSLRAPLVFVGHGIDAPELGIDDYAGVDVAGKVVVTLVGAPTRLTADMKAHLGREETKKRTAAARGAIGALRVYPTGSDQRDPFTRVARGSGAGSMTWKSPDGRGHTVAPGVQVGGLISQQAATRMLEAGGLSLAELSRAAAAGDSASAELPIEASISQRTTYEGFESPNVVALLPGRDPSLRDEHVVITAHLDHVGVGRPDGGGDDIYNGAGDNASGTAVLLEMARVLAAAPPRRSVIFVAATAEERGLVGSDYFVHNPPVPVDAIVANINLDSGVFLYDFEDIIPFGTGYSTLGENVRRVAARLELGVGDDPLPEEALFTRSDHYRFVQQGIPSMFFMCGMTARDPSVDGLAELRGYVANHLHKPSDEIELPWDWQGAARYAHFVAEVTRDVADATQRPAWLPGNVFGRR